MPYFINLNYRATHKPKMEQLTEIPSLPTAHKYLATLQEFRRIIGANLPMALKEQE